MGRVAPQKLTPGKKILNSFLDDTLILLPNKIPVRSPGYDYHICRSHFLTGVAVEVLDDTLVDSPGHSFLIFTVDQKPCFGGA